MFFLTLFCGTEFGEFVIKGEFYLNKPKIVTTDIACNLRNAYIMKFYGTDPYKELSEVVKFFALIEQLDDSSKKIIDSLIKKGKISLPQNNNYLLSKIIEYFDNVEFFRIEDFIKFYYGKNKDIMELVMLDTTEARELFLPLIITHSFLSFRHQKTMEFLNNPMKCYFIPDSIYPVIGILYQIEKLLLQDSIYNAERKMKTLMEKFPLIAKKFSYPIFLYTVILRKLGISSYKIYENKIKKYPSLYTYYQWLCEKKIENSELLEVLMLKEYICKGRLRDAEIILSGTENLLRPFSYYCTLLFNLLDRYEETLNYKNLYQDSTIQDVLMEGILYNIAEALYYTGGIYRDMAVTMYQKAMNFYRDKSLVSLAWIYSEREEWGKADSLLELMNDKNDYYLLTKGYFLYRREKFLQADSMLAKIKNIEKFGLSAFLLKILVKERLKKYHEAVLLCKDMIGRIKNRDTIAVILKKILELYVLQESEDQIISIINDARKVLDTRNENKKIFIEMLEIAMRYFMDKEDYEKALELAMEIGYLKGSSLPVEEVLYFKARKYSSEDSLYTVIKQLENINPKSKYLPELMFLYASYKIEENPEESLILFRKLKMWYHPQEIDPFFDDIYYNSFIASFLLYQKYKTIEKLDNALREGESFLKMISKKYPYYPQVLLKVSLLYLKKARDTEDFFKRREYFTKAFVLLTELKNKFNKTDTYKENREIVENTIQELENNLKK